MFHHGLGTFLSACCHLAQSALWAPPCGRVASPGASGWAANGAVVSYSLMGLEHSPPRRVFYLQALCRSASRWTGRPHPPRIFGHRHPAARSRVPGLGAWRHSMPDQHRASVAPGRFPSAPAFPYTGRAFYRSRSRQDISSNFPSSKRCSKPAPLPCGAVLNSPPKWSWVYMLTVFAWSLPRPRSPCPRTLTCSCDLLYCGLLCRGSVPSRVRLPSRQDRSAALPSSISPVCLFPHLLRLHATRRK